MSNAPKVLHCDGTTNERSHTAEIMDSASDGNDNFPISVPMHLKKHWMLVFTRNQENKKSHVWLPVTVSLHVVNWIWIDGWCVVLRGEMPVRNLAPNFERPSEEILIDWWRFLQRQKAVLLGSQHWKVHLSTMHCNDLFFDSWFVLFQADF